MSDPTQQWTLWICEVCGHVEIAADDCGKVCPNPDHDEQVMVWVEVVTKASRDRLEAALREADEALIEIDDKAEDELMEMAIYAVRLDIRDALAVSPEEGR